MKLRTFQAVCNESLVTYTVFKKGSKKTGEFENVDYFKVDYLEKDNSKLAAAVLKRMDYEKRGAEVIFVSVNHANGGLSVDIEI